MKRILLLVMIITFLLAGLPEMSASAADQTASGAWILDSIADYDAEDRVSTDGSDEAKADYIYGRAEFTINWSFTGEEDGESGSVSLSATTKYTEPPERIEPNQQVTINIALNASANAPIDDSNSEPITFELENWVTLPSVAQISASNFDDAYYTNSFEYDTPDVELNDSAQRQESIVFTLPDSSTAGVDQVEFKFQMSDVPYNENLTTVYVYKWVPGEQEPAATQGPKQSDVIELCGVVRSAESKPMPWMKLKAEVYYGAESLDLSLSPNLTVDVATDHQGRYKITIPVEPENAQPVGILLTGTMTCIYPGLEQIAFKMVDVSDANSLAFDEVSVASWLTVNPATDKDPERPDQPIRVDRTLAYYNLASGAWSFGPSGQPDPGLFYGADPNSANLLQDYSTLYTAAFDAWFFGAEVLKEEKKLLTHPVRIELRWPQSGDLGSHFDTNGYVIRLTTGNSKRNDLSRFTILHEFGHAFDYLTKPGDSFRAAKGKGANDVSHGGYFNDSTSDSYIEGFATAYAGLVQHFSGYSNPTVLDWVKLTRPTSYFVFWRNGADEEFAIAANLYHALSLVGNIDEYWKLLSPDRDNYYAYYQAIEQYLTENSTANAKKFWFNNLNSYIFKMPFGNGQYDPGEPFKDLPDSITKRPNGVYDSNEQYADLLFAVDANGHIDFSKDIRQIPDDEYMVGISTDANPDRSMRRTMELPANGYLSLSGEAVEYVLVTVTLDSGEATRLLRLVENGRVFIGTNREETAGTLEVAVPGGGVIFTADLAELQQRQLDTVGLDVPLAEAVVGADDLAAPGTQCIATYGSAGETGIQSIPEISNEELKLQADGYDPDASMAQIVAELVGRSPEALSFIDLSSYEGGGITGDDNKWLSGLYSDDSDGGGGLSSLLYRIKWFFIGSSGMARLSLIVVAVVIVLFVILKRAAHKRRRFPRKRSVPQLNSQPRTNCHSASPDVPPVNNYAPVSSKFCVHCGAPLNAHANFCSKCGQRREK